MTRPLPSRRRGVLDFSTPPRGAPPSKGRDSNSYRTCAHGGQANRREFLAGVGHRGAGHAAGGRVLRRSVPDQSGDPLLADGHAGTRTRSPDGIALSLIASRPSRTRGSMRPIRLAVALLAAAVPLAAQDGRDRAAFFITLGRDTVAVERYARTSTSIEGERVSRAPRTVLLRYHATLTPDGRLARVELVSRAVANASARPQRSVTTFGVDTATVELTVGDSTRTLKVPTGAASALLVGNAYAFYEQAVIEARQSRKDSVLVSFVAPGNPTAFPVSIRRRGADSVSIDYFGSPMLARVDERGRILGLDGRATTTKYIVTRVPDADVLAFAQTFATRETSGQAMGQLRSEEHTSELQ